MTPGVCIALAAIIVALYYTIVVAVWLHAVAKSKPRCDYRACRNLAAAKITYSNAHFHVCHVHVLEQVEQICDLGQPFRLARIR